MRTGSQSMTTRLSAVAGLFYPSDPDRLRTHVLDLLADVAASTKVMPKALTAPHAGYAYSGRAAAAAFATPRDSAQRIAHVVLIGPARYIHGAWMPRLPPPSSTASGPVWARAPTR
jgi:AmmeMemoRadiSam system protein B